MASFNLSSFDITKQAILLNCIEKERLNIVNVQETHWTDCNSSRFISHAASFFRPCHIYHSHASDNDKGAGILTIVRGSLKRKVLGFEEIIKGRLSVLKIEIDTKVVNVINWYGYHKVKSGFNTLLDKLNGVIAEAMHHQEEIVILGDLNINNHTSAYATKTKGKVFNDWLRMWQLNDIKPCPTRFTFKLSRGTDKPYTTRPDHIISTLNSYSLVWDKEVYLQHKGVCIEFSFSDQNKVVFDSPFQKLVTDYAKITEDKDRINDYIASSNPDKLQETLMELNQRYANPPRFSRLITDNREYRELENLRVNLQKAKFKDYTNNTRVIEFMNTNGITSFKEAYKIVVTLQKHNILKCLHERKESFKTAVNCLKTRTPYSYAFRKESDCSSLFSTPGITPDNAFIHFRDTVNNPLGDKPYTPLFKLKNFSWKGSQAIDAMHLISGLFKSMVTPWTQEG